jgi:hypothetical protein
MANFSLRSKILEQGNHRDFPKAGDEVEIEYVGWLLEAGHVISGKKFVLGSASSALSRTHDMPRSTSSGGREIVRMSLTPEKMIAGKIIDPRPKYGL